MQLSLCHEEIQRTRCWVNFDKNFSTLPLAEVKVGLGKLFGNFLKSFFLCAKFKHFIPLPCLSITYIYLMKKNHHSHFNSGYLVPRDLFDRLLNFLIKLFVHIPPLLIQIKLPLISCIAKLNPVLLQLGTEISFRFTLSSQSPTNMIRN